MRDDVVVPVQIQTFFFQILFRFLPSFVSNHARSCDQIAPSPNESGAIYVYIYKYVYIEYEEITYLYIHGIYIFICAYRIQRANHNKFDRTIGQSR